SLSPHDALPICHWAIGRSLAPTSDWPTHQSPTGQHLTGGCAAGKLNHSTGLGHDNWCVAVAAAAMFARPAPTPHLPQFAPAVVAYKALIYAAPWQQTGYDTRSPAP